MRLRVMAPDRVLVDTPAARVVAEATDGQFALLPRHRDWVASLVPGVLAWYGEDGRETLAAVNGGLLVKSAHAVDVVTPSGMRGGDMASLQIAVEREIADNAEREAAARTALSRLEAGIIRRFVEPRRG